MGGNEIVRAGLEMLGIAVVTLVIMGGIGGIYSWVTSVNSAFKQLDSRIDRIDERLDIIARKVV